MKFTKMHANGNDYIYIDVHKQPFDSPDKRAPLLCDRHFGVGGDGLVLLCPAEKGDFRMRIFDPDGTEAELCGNALQCSAALFSLSKGAKQRTVSVMTSVGLREINLCFEDEETARTSVMLPYPDVIFSDRKILFGEKFFAATYLSFGNPHCVVLTQDISDDCFLAYAPLLENHPLFPQRANVEFVQFLSRNHLRMRTWERGCGETLSCSTGSGAAVFAAYAQGLTDLNVTVEQPGGSIEVSLEPQAKQVTVSSMAKITFRGEFSDSI